MRVRLPEDIFASYSRADSSFNSAVVTALRSWKDYRALVEQAQREHVLTRAFALAFSSASQITGRPISEPETLRFALVVVTQLCETTAAKIPAAPAEKTRMKARLELARRASNALWRLGTLDFSRRDSFLAGLAFSSDDDDWLAPAADASAPAATETDGG